MSLKKYIVDLLQDNPLNGIGTYTDVLTLSTGVIIRKIKKLVLTGEESITMYTISTGHLFRITLPYLRIQGQFGLTGLCSHYRTVILGSDRVNGTISGGDATTVQSVVDIVDDYTNETDFKAYLAQQYTAGTPVTVWYALASETTEYITVPTGLSGTVDGYTTQTGTPTPIVPIYPTANTVTMWANYTPSRYNGIAFVTATEQPEQYNGGWS